MCSDLVVTELRGCKLNSTIGVERRGVWIDIGLKSRRQGHHDLTPGKFIKKVNETETRTQTCTLHYSTSRLWTRETLLHVIYHQMWLLSLGMPNHELHKPLFLKITQTWVFCYEQQNGLEH